MKKKKNHVKELAHLRIYDDAGKIGSELIIFTGETERSAIIAGGPLEAFEYAIAGLSLLFFKEPEEFLFERCKKAFEEMTKRSCKGGLTH